MTVLPVIDRELRTVARNPFTYSLRVVGVVVLLAVCGFIGLEENMGTDLGRRLFGSLHTTLFLTIWVFVPLLTADCISRERREGTLALLFLTPLKPPAIVVAKGLAQGLRSFTLWLAALPVLTIPFVAGGVSWKEALLSVLVNFSSLCLALAAGLVASARSKIWSRALAGAAFLSACYCLLFVLVLGLTVISLVMTSMPTGPGRALGFSFDSIIVGGIACGVGWKSVWAEILGGSLGSLAAKACLWTFAGITAISCLFLFLLVRFTAWTVNRVWHEEPPSARVRWLQDKFCQPVLLKGILRRWMRWELERNPIGWLERRTWSGRLVMWSWFAIFVSIYSTVIANYNLYQNGFPRLQALLAWLLLISLAVSASGSFRRERETGVLELLLVAPVREWQIIGGRVRGLWGHFLPSLVLLFGVWFYCAGFLASGIQFAPIAFYAMMFVTLPVVGLYFSLARVSFMSALAWTVLVGMILPAVVFGSLPAIIVNTVLANTGAAVQLFQTPGNIEPLAAIMAAVPLCLQLLVAGFLGRRLYRNLKQRRFALPGGPANA